MRDTSAATGDLQVAATACQEASEPGFRVRLALPGKELLAHHVELKLLPLFSPGQAKQLRNAGVIGKARILASAKKRLIMDLQSAGERASTIVVQRHIDLKPSLALEKSAIQNRRLIFDVDDAIWLTGRQTGGHPLGVLKGTARKVRWLAKRAEHVMAGNEILAEHLAAYNENVTVVPSLVDPHSYVLREHEQAEKVTLGWVGSRTTALYLRRIAPALERFARQSQRGVRLVIVGGRAPRLREWRWKSVPGAPAPSTRFSPKRTSG